MEMTPGIFYYLEPFQISSAGLIEVLAEVHFPGKYSDLPGYGNGVHREKVLLTKKCLILFLIQGN